MFTPLSDLSGSRGTRGHHRPPPVSRAATRPIADYFKTYMDESAIEAKGTAPVQPRFDRDHQDQDQAGVAAELAQFWRAAAAAAAAPRVPRV